MSLMSFDFFEDMAKMRREIDRILGEDRPSSWSFPFSKISFLPGRAYRAYPLMNISEDSDNFYVDALAPGLDPDSLNISVTGDHLMISGEKKALPKSVQHELIHRSERAAGKFSRNITFSASIESANVEASYTDGVIKMVLPKQEAAKPKKIAVKVG